MPVWMVHLFSQVLQRLSGCYQWLLAGNMRSLSCKHFCFGLILERHGFQGVLLHWWFYILPSHISTYFGFRSCYEILRHCIVWEIPWWLGPALAHHLLLIVLMPFTTVSITVWLMKLISLSPNTVNGKCNDMTCDSWKTCMWGFSQAERLWWNCVTLVWHFVVVFVSSARLASSGAVKNSLLCVQIQCYPDEATTDLHISISLFNSMVWSYGTECHIILLDSKIATLKLTAQTSLSIFCKDIISAKYIGAYLICL